MKITQSMSWIVIYRFLTQDSSYDNICNLHVFQSTDWIDHNLHFFNQLIPQLLISNIRYKEIPKTIDQDDLAKMILSMMPLKWQV